MGITRETVIDIAKLEGIPVLFEAITRSAFSADEALQALVRLLQFRSDGRIINNGSWPDNYIPKKIFRPS